MIKIANDKKIEYLWCFAHRLHLFATDDLKQSHITKIITKIITSNYQNYQRDIVTTLKTNSVVLRMKMSKRGGLTNIEIYLKSPNKKSRN